MKKLTAAGILTAEDLLGHYPRMYKDKSEVLDLFSMVDVRVPNTIRVTIETITGERTRNGKELIKAIVRDRSGFLSEAVWFNRKFLLQKFRAGDTVILYGKPKYEYGRLSFPSPDIDADRVGESGSITPVYPELNYIPSVWFEQKILLLKSYVRLLPDVLPEDIRQEKGFRTHAENVSAIHFPKSKADFERAREELAYEELFTLQYSGLKRKQALEAETEGRAVAMPLDADLVKEIISHLPFPLTNGQKVVLFQALKDMERPHAMQRLLQ